MSGSAATAPWTCSAACTGTACSPTGRGRHAARRRADAPGGRQARARRLAARRGGARTTPRREEGSALARIVNWLREGYPGGVPEHDYLPLLALLERRLTRSEVKKIAKALRRADVSPAGPSDIAAAISHYTHAEPSENDLRRVRDQLAEEGLAGRVPGPRPTLSSAPRTTARRAGRASHRGAPRAQGRPSGFPHGRASLAVGSAPGQGSRPRRRAERARWRLARRRRSRLTSMGSCSRAEGWSMRALSTW